MLLDAVLHDVAAMPHRAQVPVDLLDQCIATVPELPADGERRDGRPVIQRLQSGRAERMAKRAWDDLPRLVANALRHRGERPLRMLELRLFPRPERWEQQGAFTHRLPAREVDLRLYDDTWP